MAAVAAVSLEQSKRRASFERLRAQLAARPSLPVESLVPTAIPELDRLLHGGLPAGVVATLEGEIGRWSLAAGLVAGVTRRSLVAILDDGSLYPPALAEAGARLERVLVVPVLRRSLSRAQSRGSGQTEALAIARGADILLRSRICRLVLMPAVALREAVWERLAKLAHRNGALLVVVAAQAGAALSAVAAVRLHCALERVLVHGRRGLWGTIAGFQLCLDVRKHKHMLAGASAHVRVSTVSL